MKKPYKCYTEHTRGPYGGCSIPHIHEPKNKPMTKKKHKAKPKPIGLNADTLPHIVEAWERGDTDKQAEEAVRKAVGHTPREDINDILDYMWADEANHYAEAEPVDRRGHIFEALMRIRMWIDNI